MSSVKEDLMKTIEAALPKKVTKHHHRLLFLSLGYFAACSTEEERTKALFATKVWIQAIFDDLRFRSRCDIEDKFVTATTAKVKLLGAAETYEERLRQTDFSPVYDVFLTIKPYIKGEANKKLFLSMFSMLERGNLFSRDSKKATPKAIKD